MIPYHFYHNVKHKKEDWLCLGLILLLLFLPFNTSLAARDLVDENIRSAVEQELMNDQAVPYHRIMVGCNEGIVTLSGETENLLAKERALAIAETVKGVRSVVNRIKVQPKAQKSDLTLRGDVVQALFSDPATEPFEVEVEVEKGVVTLKGTVDSYVEKELVGTVVKGVHGVKEVKNLTTFKIKTDRPDNEYKEDIEYSLRWDTLVDHELIEVSVKDSKVTLTGVIGSAAEKRRAINHAWLPGIKNVDAKLLKVDRWARDKNTRRDKYVLKPDEEIRKAVEKAMFYDPRVLSTNVVTTVENGVVTLSGIVNYLSAKNAAAQDARNTVGVVRVKNHLIVDPNPGLFSDAELEKKILSNYERDVYIEDNEILVSVSSGVADLYGTVDTYFEKIRAEELASRVSGVLVVDNNLTVTKHWDPFVWKPYVDETSSDDYDWYSYSPGLTTQKSDRVIKENIKEELFWSPFVDADQVKVKVEEGKAQLTGQVDSWSEYNAATQNALEGGAVSVDNELKISYQK